MVRNKVFQALENVLLLIVARNDVRRKFICGTTFLCKLHFGGSSCSRVKAQFVFSQSNCRIISFKKSVQKADRLF